MREPTGEIPASYSRSILVLTAQMDSVPIVVICGQTISPMLGKDAFQEADVFGITAPTVKHSYLVKSSNVPIFLSSIFLIPYPIFQEWYLERRTVSAGS